ncbi:unnamed protein product [Peniophora sp. CBMAI 1063]|nr:unnamed protein product [Peniophora sp. CBMAI 1063]
MPELLSFLPTIPPSIPYTSCYCEENVWMLARHFQSDPEIVRIWHIYAVFVSNANKTVALWRQKARPDVVVWDYHVVLLARSKSRDGEESHSSPPSAWIYDMDTTLSLPCEARDYLSQTFMPCSYKYTSRFRVVPATVFLDEFASDRSHMLASQPYEPQEDMAKECEYKMPPPQCPPICGSNARLKGVRHNLMTHFVDVTVKGFGDVVDLALLTTWMERPTITVN